MGRQRRERVRRERSRAGRRGAHERRAKGEKSREHARDVLVAHHADDERHICPSGLSKVIGERSCTGWIVCSVEEHVAFPPPRALEAAGPLCRREPCADGGVIETQADIGELREQADRDRRIANLVAATQRECHRPEAVCAGLERDGSPAIGVEGGGSRNAEPLDRGHEPRRAFVARRFDHCTRAGGDRSHDDRYPRLDDAGLLAGD